MIIDGGSTDETIDIIKKYENNLNFWISEPDSGQTDAINKGFKRATGDIIAWINSDDYYCPNVLHKIGHYFNTHPECMWLAGNLYFVDQSGHIITKKRPYYSPFILRYGSSSLYQPNVFLRKGIIEIIGYPRNDFHSLMDQEWYCRIAEKFKPSIIDFDVCNFRWHSKSKSVSDKNSAYYQRFIEERKLIATHYLPTIVSSIYNVIPYLSNLLLTQIARILKMTHRIKRLIINPPQI
jgi:glycosyltransferase involved in cell wall biosynthesis